MTASTKQIRKAFEAELIVLAPALELDPDTQIQWPNVQFDDSSVAEYLRPTIDALPERVRTMGPGGRVELRGSFSIGVFVRAGSGPDRLDDLVELIKNGYSYDQDLTAGTRKVQINQRTVGPPLYPTGWAYRSVDLSWTIGI